MSAPQRDLEQRMNALANANKIRTRRAVLKQQIKEDASLLDAIELIAYPHPWMDTMKAYDLLRSLSGVGRIKADRHLKRCGISPSKTLAGLSERQRTELVRVLGEVSASRVKEAA
jgi:hypothetical protein